MKRKKLYLIIQSFLCVVLTALMAATVIGIYREGISLKAVNPLEWVYTREKVLTGLAPVLPLLLVSLVLTAAGLVFNIRDEREDRPVKDTEIQRDLIVSHVSVPSKAMKAERKKQKKLLYAGWFLFALCLIPVLLYTVNGANFPNGDLEPVFLSLAGHTFPWIAIGFTALMISAFLQEKSMQLEIEAAKMQIREEPARSDDLAVKKEGECLPGLVLILRVALLAAAVLLIIIGIFNGSAFDVFGKAVNICTECVGLG